jgi:hypothetical protein
VDITVNPIPDNEWRFREVKELNGLTFEQIQLGSACVAGVELEHHD